MLLRKLINLILQFYQYSLFENKSFHVKFKTQFIRTSNILFFFSLFFFVFFCCWLLALPFFLFIIRSLFPTFISLRHILISSIASAITTTSYKSKLASYVFNKTWLKVLIKGNLGLPIMWLDYLIEKMYLQWSTL